MLVKIVVVEVLDVAAYDRAQRAWSKLGTTTGFIGQTGGWMHNQHAVIVAFWESASAHDAFMKNGHDALEREFLGSHRAIDVLLANALVPLRGTSDLISGVWDATYLRVMDCRVAPQRADHFITVQREIWTPAMESRPGMLGGAFAGAVDDPQRFVVATLWSDKQAHDTYQREIFSRRLYSGRCRTDTKRIAGQYAQVSAEWRVTKGG